MLWLCNNTSNDRQTIIRQQNFEAYKDYSIGIQQESINQFTICSLGM